VSGVVAVPGADRPIVDRQVAVVHRPCALVAAGESVGYRGPAVLLGMTPPSHAALPVDGGGVPVDTGQVPVDGVGPAPVRAVAAVVAGQRAVGAACVPVGQRRAAVITRGGTLRRARQPVAVGACAGPGRLPSQLSEQTGLGSMNTALDLRRLAVPQLGCCVAPGGA